ncbi:MAG: polysaccharide biosynthesis/export family protein [Myxococcales bacterium]|nr:polysaccharide biosynthesis/export family protein [Myxococcales bacterium]
MRTMGRERMDIGTTSPLRAGALCGAALLASLTVLACATPVEPPPPDRVVGEVEEYVIGIPDVLQITVWKQEQLTTEALVRSDGKISMPLLQDVQAEGLTPDELRAVIEERLAEFIVAPHVNVLVKDMRSNVVSVVGGGVARSGLVPLQRNTRVLDAIATMGGFTPFARKGDIRVLRNRDGRQVQYGFDYDAFIKGRAPGSNMLLEPGDTVVVPD